MGFKDPKVEKAWDILETECGVSEETLRTVTDINGCTMKVMEDILYTTTGYRKFSQLEGHEDFEDQKPPVERENSL